MNRDKHIWEGWTVGDFIDDIEPQFDIRDKYYRNGGFESKDCLLYTSPSPRDVEESRMPSSA